MPSGNRSKSSTPVPRSSTLTKRLLSSMLKSYGFAAPLAFLLRNYAAGARTKLVATMTGVVASRSRYPRASYPTPAHLIAVEASESLFPTLYDAAAKAILIGRAFAQWSTGRLPVRVLLATPSEGWDLLRLEEPASDGSGSLRRLSVPPTNVWCVWCGEDEAARSAADLLIAWWHQTGDIKGAPDLWMSPPLGLERRLLDRALCELDE